MDATSSLRQAYAEDATISLRHAYPEDDPGLARLAELDSADAPVQRPALVAEQDGVLRAAVSIGDGRVTADPFVPTMDLVELLQLRRRRLQVRERWARAVQPHAA